MRENMIIAVIWVALGTSYAAIFYLGKKDADSQAPVPLGTICAMVMMWPFIVLASLWMMARDIFRRAN